MATETWTVRRLLEWTEDFLRKKQVESPRLEAQILLAHSLGCKKIDLYVRIDEEPAEEKRTRFRDAIKRRSEGVPVAHLVGHREFYSLAFAVSPAVLVPRPETETLVMEALKLAKPLAAPRVLDLGTGSGCIAVTLAKRHPTLTVAAVDVSPEALKVAAANVERHGVGDRVELLEGDLFAPVPLRRFDLIVSNPPYVTTAEIAGLDREVRDHEPRSALDGGTDGLDFYRRIAAEAPAHLEPGGRLLVEVGATQAADVRAIFATTLVPGPIYNDAAGRPRVVTAQTAG